MSAQPTMRTRDVVKTRAERYGTSVCELCGVRRGTNLHHRRPRGMGGTHNHAVNQASNLLWLCGSGTDGCHGDIESNRANAFTQGWLVSTWQSPADVAVRIHDYGLVLLDDVGGMTPALPLGGDA